MSTLCWECDHPCKHNDNIVSAHWEKTMPPDSLFLIRVWNNRWEIWGPAIIIYWPSFLGIDWAQGVVGVWRNSKLKFSCLTFFFRERSSCYKAGVTEIKNRKWKIWELYPIVNHTKFPRKIIPISKCWIKADNGIVSLWRNCLKNGLGQGETQTSTFPKWWADGLSSEPMNDTSSVISANRSQRCHSVIIYFLRSETPCTLMTFVHISAG